MPIQTREIREYEETGVELTSAQERLVRRLVREKLTILPGDSPNHWTIKASQFVGTVVAPGLRLLIRPKVPIANLFYLLEVGGRALEVGAEIFDYEASADLIPSFATFFTRHLAASLGHGTFHDYRQQEERLIAIRGRIDLPAQQRAAGLPLPVACEFDERTPDNQLNRLLLGASIVLLRLPGLTVSTRQTLRQLSSRLEGVGDLQPSDLHVATVFNRLNEHFNPVEKLARLVLSASSLLDQKGTTGAGAFLIDMNKVFEDFLDARLRTYLAGRLNTRGQCPHWLDVAHSVRVKPDLVFESPGGRVAYVADTKYKVSDDGFGQQSDYYQLLAYATVFNLSEGLLIYCQRDGSALPQEIEVLQCLIRLRTRAIRLDRSPRHIEEELKTLADEIAIRAVSGAALMALSPEPWAGSRERSSSGPTIRHRG